MDHYYSKKQKDSKKGRIANLSGANLSKKKIIGPYVARADISKTGQALTGVYRTNLKGAILSGANLNKSTIGWADFDGADLMETDFRKAEFKEADFNGANLLKAMLQDSDLQWANFSGSKNLTFDQLGGAILTHTTIGADMGWGDYLPSVRLASSQARKLFAPMVAICVYLLMGVLFGKADRNYTIPLIQWEEDLDRLLSIGAIALAVITTYLMYYLNTLWNMISKLPAIFPHGTPVYEHPDPWFIINYCRLHLYQLRRRSGKTSLLFAVAAGLIVYVLPFSVLLILSIKTINLQKPSLTLCAVISCLWAFSWAVWGAASSIRTLRRLKTQAADTATDI